MTATPAAPGVSVRALPWDSDFFGFPVVRLVGDGDLSLDAAIAELRADGVRLAYLGVETTDTELGGDAVRLGGRLVDRRVELQAQCRPAAAPDDVAALSKHPDAADRAVVHALALASGELSRFRVDPDITDRQFEALYDIWIDNSIAGGQDQTVLVIRNNGRIGGMITVSARDGNGNIGLFAVDAACRGRGLGGRLLRGALAWSGRQGCSNVRVATQAANAGALAAYHTAGFATDRVSDTYHFWIRP